MPPKRSTSISSPLPAVIIRRSRRAATARRILYDDVPGNVALDYHYGDAEAVKAAFAKAAHVTRLKLVNSRLVVAAMEPRAALAAYDGSRFTLYVGSQGVFGMRANIAEALGVAAKDVRILTGQVGGSFGMKAAVFPEYICLLHAARALGRPVKWTDERSGSFVSDSHGRNHDVAGELALDADGTFPRRAPDELRQYGRVPVAGRADAGHAQCREERAGHVSHAADRSLHQVRCSPIPRMSPPIAAPAGPKATTTWSG